MPESDTPEALARKIAVRMQNEWKEGVVKNELRARIAKEYGMNAEHVRRYLRILKLMPELLQLVNEGNISIHAGAELSFLSAENQKVIFEYLAEMVCGISINEATLLKKEYRNKPLKRNELEKVISDKENVEVMIPYGRVDIESFEEVISEKKLYERVYKIIHNWEDFKKRNA